MNGVLGVAILIQLREVYLFLALLSDKLANCCNFHSHNLTTLNNAKKKRQSHKMAADSEFTLLHLLTGNLSIQK